MEVQRTFMVCSVWMYFRLAGVMSTDANQHCSSDDSWLTPAAAADLNTYNSVLEDTSLD